MPDKNSSWGDCPSCGEYALLKFHNECKPEWQWRLIDADFGPLRSKYDTWSSVRAWNWIGAAECAAQIYNEMYNDGVSDEFYVEIAIRSTEGEEQKFKIHIVDTPQYSVEQIT